MATTTTTTMAQATNHFLRMYLNKEEGLDLLDNVHFPENLEWLPQNTLTNAPSDALVIGTRHEVQLLACAKETDGKPTTIRFYKKPIDSSHIALTNADEICHGEGLQFPFIALKGWSRGEQLLTLFIRYNFQQTGRITEKLEETVREFGRQMYLVLDTIDDYVDEIGLPGGADNGNKHGSGQGDGGRQEEQEQVNGQSPDSPDSPNSPKRIIPPRAAREKVNATPQEENVSGSSTSSSTTTSSSSKERESEEAIHLAPTAETAPHTHNDINDHSSASATSYESSVQSRYDLAVDVGLVPARKRKRKDDMYQGSEGVRALLAENDYLCKEIESHEKRLLETEQVVASLKHSIAYANKRRRKNWARLGRVADRHGEYLDGLEKR